MNELISVNYRVQITQENVHNYFGSEKINSSLADILLVNPATVIYHIDSRRMIGENEFYLLPLGVNYHNTDNSLCFRTMVQDVQNKKGPWTLFNPPFSSNKIFYLQGINLNEPRSFEYEVRNLSKIKKFYVFRGDPFKIFRDFREKGFCFTDNTMSKDESQRLLKLEIETRKNN